MRQIQAAGLKPDLGKAEAISVQTSNHLFQDEWKLCLSSIKEELPWQTFQTWFLPIAPVSLIEDTLLLRVPSRFFYEWIEGNYNLLLKKAVAKAFGLNTRVEFSIAPSENPQDAESRAEFESSLPAVEVPGEEIQESRETLAVPASTFDHRFNFSNYFCGGGSELAVRAAQFVAANPGQLEYNPLVLCGGTGSGKTHLVHSVGNSVSAENKNLRILLLNSENFLHDYVQALQTGKVNAYIARLCKMDMLLLEDVHFLANKSKSQEGLLFILSKLIRQGCQVVITSQQLPGRLTQFNQRLISFMQKGLIVDILGSDPASRELYIRHLLKKNGLYLDEKAIFFLADHLKQNMHELSAIMIRIIAQISLLGKNPTLVEIQHMVSRMCPEVAGEWGALPDNRHVGMDDIINATASYFKIPVDILQGVSRKKKVVKARQIAIYLCREITGDSLSSIGYHFSGLHHASVLYAHRKVEDGMAADPRLKTVVANIKSLLAS